MVERGEDFSRADIMFITTHQGTRGDVGAKVRLPMLVPPLSALL